MAVRFLIVDDYSAHQNLLANIIQYLGGVMRYAANGLEAMHLAQSEEFDILLMDLQMPGLGGIAAADRLIHGWSAHPHRPRIVAVTADNTPERRALCRAVGMDGFIAKPSEAKTLKNALQEVIMFGHCWTDGAPERTLDMKRFLKAAAAMNFDAWAVSAAEVLRAAEDDSANLAEFQTQAHHLGFLSLDRLLGSLASPGARPSFEGVLPELGRCIALGYEALNLSQNEALAAA